VVSFLKRVKLDPRRSSVSILLLSASLSLLLVTGLLLPRDVSGTPSGTPPAFVFGDSTGTPGFPPLKGGVPPTPRDKIEGEGGKLFAPQDSTKKDSLGRKPDIDTTYVVFTDSTWRLMHWTRSRYDAPQVQIFPDRLYPLYAPARIAGFQRQAVLDSTGNEFRFAETYGNENVKVPVSVPFDEYVRLRQKFEMRKMLADEARKPKNLGAKNDLGELLSSITKITIPVPPNPLFSIFGKNEISLNISGSVNIKAGFRNTKSDQTTLSSLDQSRNEPDFQQEVQVNVNGMIGDKLSILADWNTQRTFEYENQLKIKYTGYDDEIVQSVEAGNVSLTTPSAFIGSSQALFGIKAKFQTGPLTLTTIASQKKGQIKEVSVSGGSQETNFEISPSAYSTNHFLVDTVYESWYERYYQNDPPQIDPNLQIVEEEVWMETSGQYDPLQRDAVVVLDLPAYGSQPYSETLRSASALPGVVDRGTFIKLTRGTQYELAGDGHIGLISFNTNVPDNKSIGIAYRVAGGGTQYGEFVRNRPDSTIVLRMLKPRNLVVNPQYRIPWRRMLKNIYALPGRNTKEQGFTLDIFLKQSAGEAPNTIPPSERLLRILGLDRYNADGTPAPNGDNAFDFRPDKTISTARGEIIFPYLKPFAEGIQRYYSNNNITPPDSFSQYLYPEIYDTTKSIASQRQPYVIRGKATGEASSKFNLGFNVVEGSVQVLLDGRRLTPNVDYTVDYIVGEIVIRNNSALVPGANLQIKYEQNDLFQLASKTLLGARGDVAVSKNINFGFTVMNLNQQTLSDKVRLGEEPNKNTIMGVDAQTQFDLPFLTSGLDALPLLETREMSTFRLTGEAAYMSPDPNTKKSSIPSDNGAGIAYIDDFEGARRTIPLGVSYAQWFDASPPADPAAISSLGSVDTLKMFAKGKTIWYNILPTDVALTDVYPKKEPGNAANNQLTVLNLRYFPDKRGMYNYSPNLDSTLTPTANWGGIMRPVSISATNLLTENINFIEFWALIDPAANREAIPKLRIDLGSISEEVIPNRPLRTEDLVLQNSRINQTLQVGEDVGLDMMSNAEELARYGNGWGSDPSGDDYYFDNGPAPLQRDYTHINGTENNKNSPSGLIPDTEDLNSNNSLDQANIYMEYEVPLDTVATRNPYIVGGGGNSDLTKRWYQYRIPVRSFTRLVGSGTPNFENVESIRLSFLNANDTVAVRLADIALVGNQWQEEIKGDPRFAVTVVSIEDNPSYSSPPGVVRERDKTQPDQTILANEQSLALKYDSLASGDSRQAVKWYTYKALDVFSYREMKMFVHGDLAWENLNTPLTRPQVFFRFGYDSLNYYEYRGPLDTGWTEIGIKFSELTAIKQLRDTVTQAVMKVLSVINGDSTMYRVVGNPSLTQIRWLAVGAKNRSSATLTGEVWFNELRLTDVDDSPGWAYRFDANLKLADFASVSFNYSKVDPNFHTLEQRFGSRQTGINWGLNASAQLEKLFPSDWVGTSFAVSYSRTVSLTRPKYLPNSDVLVDEAAQLQTERMLRQGYSSREATSAADALRTAAETYRVTDTYAAPNFRLGFPSQAWYIRDTFNKLSFGFNYTKSNERSPATVRRYSWSWNTKITYAHNFSPDYYFQPFRSIFDGLWFLDEYKDVKIFFTPQSFTWSINAMRSRDVSLQRVQNALETITRNFTASRQFGFGWKLSENGLVNPSGNYNLSVESSLLGMELDRNKNQRSFSKIMNDIFFSDKLINFGTDTRYSQQNQITTRPNIPNILGIKKYLDLTFGYSVDYSWQNSLTQGDLGKSAGWGNNINVSANLKLKQMFDPLFEPGPSGGAPSPPPGRGRGRGDHGDENDAGGPKGGAAPADTTATTKPSTPGKMMDQLKNIAKLLFKIPLLDYDNINITFTQTNATANSGVVGAAGFVNFWGRLPFQDPKLKYGPSRLYQLGLISDPSGRLGRFGLKSAFPFFGWDETVPGLRAPNGQLQNSFRQQNRIALKTSRALWEGARIDLNWSVGWTYSKTQTVQTDEFGNPTVLNVSTAGTVERSFMSFPDVLMLGMFKSSLKDVSKRYAELKNNKADTLSNEEKLARAFEEGFEALPILRKVFGQYAPRVNWALRWDGLEKIPLFAGFASRVSLEHAYASTYTRAYENRPGGGGERTSGQRVTYGFSPLIGMNFTFKDLFKGSLGSNLRYNTNTSFDLQTSATNIVETLTQEVSVTMNYSKRGFEIPFFGLSLNNDLDISASYSLSRNSRKTYEVAKLEVNTTGQPLEGSTRTVLEPRIKYVLSSRVTASVYYRLTKITPDESGSRIPGSTINEAGLDIQISIQ
jgi:hypothetical protein